MKNLLLVLLTLASFTALGQEVRIDPFPASSIGGSITGLAYPPILAVPNAAITLCNYPANGYPCTNFATTYTDATGSTACPSNAQVTWPGSSSCVNSASVQGRFGFWVPSGTYTYMVTPIGKQPYGPYPVSAGGSGSAGGGGGIYTHNLSGSSPAAVLNSIYNPAIDIEYLTLTSNTAAIALPAAGQVADGEILYFTISQASIGGPFTLATTIANAPLAAGGGTALNSAIPGSCPTLGSVVSSSAPSQLFVSVQYQLSPSIYTILGCEAFGVQNVVEFALPASTGQFGGYLTGTPLVGIVTNNIGHFTNLQVISLGGVCTTPPKFNVFSGASSFGNPITAVPGAQGVGGGTNLAQTLPFGAGTNIGVFVSSAGVGCKYAYFSVIATLGEP